MTETAAFLASTSGAASPARTTMRLLRSVNVLRRSFPSRRLPARIRQPPPALDSPVCLMQPAIHELGERGYVERTERLGRYRLTAVGRMWLEESSAM